MRIYIFNKKVIKFGTCLNYVKYTNKDIEDNKCHLNQKL